MTRIEQLWASMREGGVAAQRRVTAEHACDIYADFTPPDQVGLVAICDDQVALPRAMRAIAVERGERADGRFSLRLALHHQPLLPVFTALCQDIIASTSKGATAAGLAATILHRLERWRALLERDASGLVETTLRGLIGELTILETHLLPRLRAHEAVIAWRGPFGAPQDFLLADGRRIEVKAVDRNASEIVVNGLAQLDPGSDQLTLVVVRLQVTGAHAAGAISAVTLIDRIRTSLSGDPEALSTFETALSHIGWHEHPSHAEFTVRIIAMEAYSIEAGFPRLTQDTVPSGIVDAAYQVSLRDQMFDSWTLAP